LLNAKWTIVESGVKHHQTNKPNGHFAASHGINDILSGDMMMLNLIF
jgi:hypothetical protein